MINPPPKPTINGITKTDTKNPRMAPKPRINETNPEYTSLQSSLNKLMLNANSSN